MEESETLAKLNCVIIESTGRVVTLNFICYDEYEAHILAEDLIDRLRSGESVSITNVSVAET